MSDIYQELQNLKDQRAEINKQGRAALFRLVKVAKGDTGQSGVVALFLLGCYNGQEWPFDLSELRRLDAELVDDCLSVLALDARPEREIHHYIQDGDEFFSDLWRRYRPGDES